MQRVIFLALILLSLSTFSQAKSIQSMQEIASIGIPNGRFYSIQAIDDQDDTFMDLLAAGQIRQEQHDKALIIAFSQVGGKYQEIARETFSVDSIGDADKTRIRSLLCYKRYSPNKCLIIVNGKAVAGNKEIGFIRTYTLNNQGFNMVDHKEFSDPNMAYTHGYSLIQEDINGDKKNEVIYGGFSGKNDRDTADIHIFSIKPNGKLKEKNSFQKARLNTLPLRINALVSGDLTGDEQPEIIAAGRTENENNERAALAIFSNKLLTWSILNDFEISRYRCATIADLTKDGQKELVLGGRIEIQDTLYALIDIWQFNQGKISLKSRFCFTGAGSTRMRVIKPFLKTDNSLLIAGRLESLENNQIKWKGFLQEIALTSNTLSLSSAPTMILEKTWETRVRSLDINKQNLFAAGFSKDKKGKSSTGFIRIYQCLPPA